MEKNKPPPSAEASGRHASTIAISVRPGKFAATAGRQLAAWLHAAVTASVESGDTSLLPDQIRHGHNRRVTAAGLPTPIVGRRLDPTPWRLLRHGLRQRSSGAAGSQTRGQPTTEGRCLLPTAHVCCEQGLALMGVWPHHGGARTMRSDAASGARFQFTVKP